MIPLALFALVSASPDDELQNVSKFANECTWISHKTAIQIHEV